MEHHIINITNQSLLPSSMVIEPIVVKTELATPQDFHVVIHVGRDGS